MVKKKLIYGCMGLGGDWNNNPLTNEDFIKAQKAVEAALESGIDYFDHADIYTLGKAEKVFGELLKNNSSLRDKMVLQSKAGICIGAGAGGSNIYDASEPYLTRQVDAILKRLHTDYLDVFMLHRPDPLMNSEEVGATFNSLKKAGKVKRFGVSNMSVSQIKAIQKHCDEPLVANQMQLSLGHSLVIDSGVLVNTINKADYNGVEGLLEYGQAHDMAIQSWGSLDGGRFSGNSSLAANEDKKTIELVNQLSEKYQTTASSIQLAWLFKIPGNVQPIIGSSNPKRILACKDAPNIELSRGDWYDLWITARGEKIP